MTKLDPQEAQITDWLASQQEAMLALLREVVNTDSGSYDKAGVDAVGARFIDFFSEQGLLTTREPHDTLRRRHPHPPRRHAAPTRSPILLMGHRDTVFPKGEAARRPFRIEDGRAYGPGVCDMKGGLVLNAFVLAAFKRFGGAPAPLAGLITSDEEIASPSSRPDHRARRRARRAACSTPSPAGPAATSSRARKGGVFLRLRGDRQGRALGRQLREGHQRHRRAGAQDRRHARADRPDARHHRQCRHSSRAASPSTPRRRTPRARSTCATSSPQQRATALGGAAGRSSIRATVPGTTAKLEISGEFLPLTATPASEELFATYRAAAADAGLDTRVADGVQQRLRGQQVERRAGGRAGWRRSTVPAVRSAAPPPTR